MMKSISRQAKRIYDAILKLEAKLSRRPFQQEIANEAGYKSKSSANKYIGELERAGWIQRDYLGLNTLRSTD